ncbi:MAG TPA: class I SAM-dependent methyltransferase [Phycisphaeraceae bacterium]|nr:class I SAM-dependent methyltransferase [Phycisphaeraceae bacterium]
MSSQTRNVTDPLHSARADKDEDAIFSFDQECSFDFARINVIHDTPAMLVKRERLLLYSMVIATAPTHALEIGTHKGGGSKIISSALADLGMGKLATLDPFPDLCEVSGEPMTANTVFLKGASPWNLPDARKAIKADRGFQFCFIDGSHEYEDVLQDLDAVRNHLDDEACILMHDAYYPGVRQAIHEAIANFSCYVDAGMLTNTRNKTTDGDVYGGLYFLRFIRTPDTPALQPLPAT